MTYASAAPPLFYHGTRADLAPGDLLAPGHASNYADRKLSWIDFSGTLDVAILGVRASQRRGRKPEAKLCTAQRGPEIID